MSSSPKPTILLVHGAWHGSWCWAHLTPELESAGYAVATVDLPCTSGTPGTTQFDDAAAVRAALEPLLAAGRRVVVAAHSYAGPIGNAAIVGSSQEERAARGLPGGVVGFVAVCAYLLPGGLDQGAAIRAIGGLPYVTWDAPSEGLFVLNDPRGLLFPPDVPAELVDWAVARLKPQSSAANTGVVPPQAWKEDAARYAGRFGYVRCTADAVLPIDQQDGYIEGAGGDDKWVVRTLEGSSHSPHLSRPRELAAVLDDIIRQFEGHIV